MTERKQRGCKEPNAPGSRPSACVLPGAMTMAALLLLTACAPLSEADRAKLEAGQNRALADKEIAWLKAHPLTPPPEADARPKSEETCVNKIARRIDAARPELPEYLRMALIEEHLTPWSFVKFDIEEDGRTSHVRPFDSAGYPPFDAQSKKYLEAAAFELRPGIAMAIGCVMYFDSNDAPQRSAPLKKDSKLKKLK